jgi:hypothetical protein
LLGAAELQGEPVQGLLVRPQREDHRPPPRRPLLHHLPPGDANGTVIQLVCCIYEKKNIELALIDACADLFPLRRCGWGTTS